MIGRELKTYLIVRIFYDIPSDNRHSGGLPVAIGCSRRSRVYDKITRLCWYYVPRAPLYLERKIVRGRGIKL